MMWGCWFSQGWEPARRREREPDGGEKESVEESVFDGGERK